MFVQVYFVLFLCICGQSEALIASHKKLAATAHAQAKRSSVIDSVRSAFSSFEYELEATAADEDIGSDVKLQFLADKEFSTSYSSRENSRGPRNLKEYCAGETRDEHQNTLTEGKRVMVDWEQYGAYYPGTIEVAYPDSTYKVHYDDGFDEDHVEPQQIRAMTSSEKKSHNKIMRNDPACKFQGVVTKVKPAVSALQQKMAKWTIAQRAELSEGKIQPPPKSDADGYTVSAGSAPAAAEEEEENKAKKTEAPAGITGAGASPAPALPPPAQSGRQPQQQAITGQEGAAAITKQPQQQDIADEKGAGATTAQASAPAAARITSFAPAPGAAAIRAAPAEAAAIMGQEEPELVFNPPLPDKLAAELRGLEHEIEKNDKIIQELKVTEEDNARKLQKFADPEAPPAPAGSKSVEALMQEYKDRIAMQKLDIERRRKRIEDQEIELARLGASQEPLADINKDASQLAKEVKGAEKEMDALNNEGAIDPDLKLILDGVLKPISRTKEQVGKLMKLESKAKEQEEKEEARVEAASKAAHERALAAGMNARAADMAAEKAGLEAEQATEDRVQDVEMQTLIAAQDITYEFSQSESEAQELNTGLHPHGDKWWRYRYEHSYIEAILMIWISLLMLLWRYVVERVKDQLQVFAVRRGEKAKHELGREIGSATDGKDDGTLFLEWLSCLAEMCLTCVLVFITVWAICKSSLPDYLPWLIGGATAASHPTSLMQLFSRHNEPVILTEGGMHTPSTGDQYRHLVIDLASIYFFAIILYFAILFPVAADVKRTTHKLANQYIVSARSMSSASLGLGQKAGKKREAVSAVVMGTLAKSHDQYVKDEQWFADRMKWEMKHRTEPEIEKLKELVDWDQFPLSRYLIMNVHVNTSFLLFFGWHLWCLVCITFILFALMHSFLHVGYVRIMSTFAILSFGIIAAIAYFTRSVASIMDRDPQAEDTKEEWKHTVHTRYNTESHMLITLKFTLFFTCYGVSRMVCQPWMWVLHFWPVLGLTITAIILAVAIIIVVLPVLPSFCAAMALPPHVNRTNLKLMIHAQKAENLEQELATTA